MSRPLNAEEIDRQLAELPGWEGDAAGVRRTYTAPAFLAGVDIVREVAVAAEEMDHHPDIDIRWRSLTFFLVTHSAGGVTQLDIELAHRIHDTATRAGAT